MQDDKTDLPEGTDRIIAGASAPTVSNSGAVGTGTTGTGTDEGDVLVVEDVGEATTGSRGRDAIIDKLRTGREKLSSQAADRTRGLVGQGLERSAEALANVGKLVGDTADGLDERLCPEYGEYARKAATAIENAANSIASKDADELIDDTREFVRQSPGIALAGAAIVGFAVARLIKSGLAREEDDTRGNRRGGSRGKREG